MRRAVPFAASFLILAAAACSTTSNSAPGYLPAPTPTPTASAAPLAIATVAPLAINNSGGITQPIPAPTGYTSQLSIPIANASAGTTVAITSSATLPASLPVLDAKHRSSRSVRIPSATTGLTSIFFDSLVPSAPITVAGNVSVTQGFPAGTLSAGASYYLAFYDSTASSPAWQTISGPITSTDNLNLTFSGSIKSFTLSANQLYGFAIFTTAGGTASPPPTPPATLVYIGTKTNIQEISAAGVVATTLPIPAAGVGLDDADNLYALTLAPTPAPSTSPVAAPPTIAKYTAGTTTIAATYTPSNDNGYFVLTGGAGTLAILGPTDDSYTSETVDVWDAGSTGGAPSRTLTAPIAGVLFGIMEHDGTIVMPANTATTIGYAFYPPGSSTPNRTITDTIVSPDQAPYFDANYAAVGPDGTLYVTEYGFYQTDPNAGLYIYPPSGPEKFVATTADANGPGPQGVDVDASGNVYVINNNFAYNTPTGNTAQGDSLHDLEVFGPLGTGTPRHVTGTFTALPLAVASDGTAFFSGFPIEQLGVYGSYAVQPGSSTVTQISTLGTAELTLYDGNRESTANKRKVASVVGAHSAHGVGVYGLHAHIRRSPFAKHH